MSYHLGRSAKALATHEERALTATSRSNSLIGAMTSKIDDLSSQQAVQSAATSGLSDRMEENAQYQSVMTHHLGRTADALASHDEVALKLREIDETLNGRIDDLSGAIGRSSGNIESLTEEIIRLGEHEEKALDQEYQRMMGDIDRTIERQRVEQQSDAVAREAVAVNANAGMQRPAAAPSTPTYSDTPLQVKTDSSDPVSAMRDKLAGVYGQRKDEEV